LLSPNNFEIKADIPETDIGEVDTDDEVKITLDAFPEEIYKGEILEIDPSETIIDGVVYYRVVVLFDKPGQKIRSGMSGDVMIQTAKKEGVLHVPQRAIITRNGDKLTRVLNGEELQETKVITGLRGSDGEIEIISGLDEGEKVITLLKKTTK
jgi:HlyD family secretion protein